MRALRITILIFMLPALGLAAEAPKLAEKDIYILKLQKTIAELQMELFQMKYLKARELWKEQIKALGEPDPDEAAGKKEDPK